MRTAPRRHAPSRPRESVILFTVAGCKFAISAAAVDEIRAAEGLRDVSGAALRAANVRHLLQREQKTYCVVDAAAHFHLPSCSPARVLLLHGCAVGLGVEATDRMAEITEIHALPRAFTGEERRWYRGVAVIEAAVVPVVSPRTFASRAELALLQARTAGSALGTGAPA